MAGVFHFSGGMPGITSYDYRFLAGSNGDEPAAGTVQAAADGSAQITFTPPAVDDYTVLVTGHSADGTATSEAGYRFQVADS